MLQLSSDKVILKILHKGYAAKSRELLNNEFNWNMVFNPRKFLIVDLTMQALEFFVILIMTIFVTKKNEIR